MPIRRNYMCQDCGYYMTVEMAGSQWNAPEPDCPACMKFAPKPMQQDFQPVAIGGSHAARANELTEKILSEDYHVADIQRDRHAESRPQVRYKDDTPASRATWGAGRAALEGAIAAGRQSRLRYGSGLDILHSNLRSGAEPDLIANSKRRAMRIY